MLAFLLVMLLALPLGFYGAYLFSAPTLPSIDSLRDAPIEMPMQVYTRDGKLVGEFGEKLSDPVTYNQIPKQMVQAFLAAEDATFFTHSGVSVKGLGRAVTEAIQGSGSQTGGSTITMQVAKNYFLTPERTIKRKLTEIFLAREIERNLSKPEIFTLYVNKIFLGQHAYGISAAAKVYYNKALKDLTVAEMAMIAGLPKAPSKYNPVVNPKRALERRNWIIGRMLQLGFISQTQYQQAVSAPLGLNLYKRQLDFEAPYLAEMVRSEMVDKFGSAVLNSGWKVYTTVGSHRQSLAIDAVKNGIEAYDARHGWRGVEAKNKPLDEFVPVGKLIPAQVIKVKPNGIDVRLQDGSTVDLPWSAMNWARRYHNANHVGGGYSSPAQMVEVGDIIRLRPQPDGKAWKMAQLPNVQGQLIALDPTNGAIEAVVGGYDFAQSKFNRSVQGWRQPGSTIKPFIYALALERGYGPTSTVQDSPLRIGRWRPQNSDGRFLGAITLRRALYLSRNLVSIRLLDSVGIERAREYISHFGLVKSELPANLTLALGTAQALPVQIATGYAAFANGGYRVQPYFIDRVIDNTGQQLYKADPPRVCSTCVLDTDLPVVADDSAAAQGDQPDGKKDQKLIQAVNADGSPATPVPDLGAEQLAALADQPFRQAERIMKPGAAYHMASILRDVVQHGTGRAALKIGRNDIGGKTGTTNDAKDAWFSGFQPTLMAVTWVGFDQPATLGRSEFGGVAALPIWSQFMEKALDGVPAQWVTLKGVTEKKARTQSEVSAQARREEAYLKAQEEQLAPPLARVIYRQPAAAVAPTTPPPTSATSVQPAPKAASTGPAATPAQPTAADQAQRDADSRKRDAAARKAREQQAAERAAKKAQDAKAKADKPKAEKPRAEKPAEEKPKTDPAKAEKPAEEKPKADKPAESPTDQAAAEARRRARLEERAAAQQRREAAAVKNDSGQVIVDPFDQP